MKKLATLVVSLSLIGLVSGCGHYERRVNPDAMTKQSCKERFSMPKDRRPKPADPRVDLDAVCKGILGATAPASAHAAMTVTGRRMGAPLREEPARATGESGRG